MKRTLCGKEFGPGSPSITSEDWLCATGALFSLLEPLPVTTEAAGSTPPIPRPFFSKWGNGKPSVGRFVALLVS